MNYVIVDVICVNISVLTSDDKALIKALRVEKGWNVDRMMCEFPARQWKRRTLYDLVRKIDQTGSTDRLTVSGRRRTAANIRNIGDLICRRAAWHQQEPKRDQSGNWYFSKLSAENSEGRSEAESLLTSRTSAVVASRQGEVTQCM